MGELGRRVRTLEDKKGFGGRKPFYSVQQSYDDPNIYVGRDGQEYTESDLPSLEEKYTLVVVKWADTWPPGELGGDSEHIRLKWPEEI